MLVYARAMATRAAGAKAKAKGGLRIAPFVPPRAITPAQLRLRDTIREARVTVVTGPAGCGKTFWAIHEALDALARGDVRKCILTRPMVTADEPLGFLPGDTVSKLSPYLTHMFDMIKDRMSAEHLAALIREDVIEVSPLGLQRGRTYKDMFVIADEMQNATCGQAKMLLTRMGPRSTLVVTGDVTQSDRHEGAGQHVSCSGLEDVVERLRRADCELLKLVELGDEDVVRDPVVVEALRLYEQ